MGRPIKNNCDYFPHLTTMRNHKKVKALRNKFGQVLGYAFWSMFIEYLTEQDGNELEDSEIELEMFAGELGVSVTEIQDMVNYCCKIELLFVNPDGFIYSESLNENLTPVFDKRKKAKDISKSRKRRQNGQFSEKQTQSSGITDTETPQSKVEYSKGDESKEDINIKRSLVFDFEKLKMELDNSGEWKDDVCRAYKLPWNDVNEQLQTFLLEQKALDNLHRSFSEIKEHFGRWLKIQISNKLRTNGNNFKSIPGRGKESKSEKLERIASGG